MMQSFTDLFDKQFLLNGGLLIALSGSLIGIVKGLPGRVWNWILRITSLSFEIHDNDSMFSSFAEHAAKQKFIFGLRSIHISSGYQENNCIFHPDYKRKKKTSSISSSPSTGTHWFFYKKRLCKFTRVLESNNVAERHKQRIYVTMYSKNRCVFNAFIKEVEDYHNSLVENKIHLYKYHEYDYWHEVNCLDARGVDTVIFDQKEDILSDVRSFLSSRQEYIKMGIPYRRGYLFYGSPGNGKTSMIHAIASEFLLNVYRVNLSDKKLTDEGLQNAVANVKSGLVVMEDIDAAFNSDRSSKESSLTMSGVLNAINGISTSHGQIFIMTTNHKDRLDPALIRPGRADKHYQFNNPGESEIRAFAAKLGIDLSEKTISILMDASSSMATVQGALLACKNDSVAIASYLETLN